MHGWTFEARRHLVSSLCETELRTLCAAARFTERERVQPCKIILSWRPLPIPPLTFSPPLNSISTTYPQNVYNLLKTFQKLSLFLILQAFPPWENFFTSRGQLYFLIPFDILSTFAHPQYTQTHRMGEKALFWSFFVRISSY